MHDIRSSPDVVVIRFVKGYPGFFRASWKNLSPIGFSTEAVSGYQATQAVSQGFMQLQQPVMICQVNWLNSGDLQMFCSGGCRS